MRTKVVESLQDEENESLLLKTSLDICHANFGNKHADHFWVMSQSYWASLYAGDRRQDEVCEDINFVGLITPCSKRTGNQLDPLSCFGEGESFHFQKEWKLRAGVGAQLKKIIYMFLLYGCDSTRALIG